MAAGASERRRGDRRSGAERRVAVLPFPAERRQSAERRAADRRVTEQSPIDQLTAALELLTRVAEEAELDDVIMRVLDGAVLRVRTALDHLDRPRP